MIGQVTSFVYNALKMRRWWLKTLARKMKKKKLVEVSTIREYLLMLPASLPLS